MPDDLSESYATVDAAGNVTFDFDGSIHARGLELDSGAGLIVPTSEITWQRALDGALVARIAAVHNPDPQGATHQSQLKLLAQSTGDFVGIELSAYDTAASLIGTQLTLIRQPAASVPNRAMIQCDDDLGGGFSHFATLLDGSGSSTFLLGDTTRAGRYRGRLTVAELGALTDLRDGDTCELIANAAGVLWAFRYNAAAAPYKWEFVGGPPIEAIVQTTEAALVVGAWGNLATDGPLVLVPRTGDYQAWGSAQAEIGGGPTTTYIGIAAGNTPPLTQRGTTAAAASLTSPAITEFPFAAVVTGTALKLRYYAQQLSDKWSLRAIAIRPVRIL